MTTWKDIVIGLLIIALVLIFSCALVTVICVYCPRFGLSQDNFLLIPIFTSLALMVADAIIIGLTIRKMFGFDKNGK